MAMEQDCSSKVLGVVMGVNIAVMRYSADGTKHPSSAAALVCEVEDVNR